MGPLDSVSRTQRKVYLMNLKNLARTNTLAYRHALQRKKVLCNWPKLWKGVKLKINLKKFSVDVRTHSK
jgi:hypothetical protein